MKQIFPYFVVATGALGCFIPCALSLSCAGIFFVPVSNSLNVNVSSFASYLTVVFLVVTVSLPFIGKMMASKDLRVVLSLAALCTGGALVSMSFFVAVWQFYAAAVFVGIGLAVFLILAVPVLINRWFSKNVGFYVGLCMAFSGIGGVVFNMLGGVIISSAPDGWRTAYLVFGLIVLIVMLPFTLFGVRSHPEDLGLKPVGWEDSTLDKEKERHLDGEKSSSSQTWSFALYFLMLFVGTTGLVMNFYQYLPTYASSLLDHSDVGIFAAVLASSTMSGQAVGKIFLGIVSDRLGAFAGVVLASSCGIAGLFLMWQLPDVIPALLVGGFIFGLFCAGSSILGPLLIRYIFGNQDYSLMCSRVGMAGSLGAAAAASVWGGIVDVSGFEYTFILGILGVLLAMLFAVSAVKSKRSLC